MSDCIGRGELHLTCGAVVHIDVEDTFDQCAAAVKHCIWKELTPTRAISLSSLLAAAWDV